MHISTGTIWKDECHQTKKKNNNKAPQNKTQSHAKAKVNVFYWVSVRCTAQAGRQLQSKEEGKKRLRITWYVGFVRINIKRSQSMALGWGGV